MAVSPDRWILRDDSCVIWNKKDRPPMPEMVRTSSALVVSGIRSILNPLHLDLSGSSQHSSPQPEHILIFSVKPVAFSRT